MYIFGLKSLKLSIQYKLQVPLSELKLGQKGKGGWYKTAENEAILYIDDN